MPSLQRENIYKMSRWRSEQSNSEGGQCPHELVHCAAMLLLRFATGKSNPHLPSDNCSQHFFPLNYSRLTCLWIYCRENAYLTSSQYIIHSATALPCHMTPKGEWKREQGGKRLSKILLFCTLDSNLSWRESDLVVSCGSSHRWKQLYEMHSGVAE